MRIGRVVGNDEYITLEDTGAYRGLLNRQYGGRTGGNRRGCIARNAEPRRQHNLFDIERRPAIIFERKTMRGIDVDRRGPPVDHDGVADTGITNPQFRRRDRVRDHDVPRQDQVILSPNLHLPCANGLLPDARNIPCINAIATGFLRGVWYRERHTTVGTNPLNLVIRAGGNYPRAVPEEHELSIVGNSGKHVFRSRELFSVVEGDAVRDPGIQDRGRLISCIDPGRGPISRGIEIRLDRITIMQHHEVQMSVRAAAGTADEPDDLTLDHSLTRLDRDRIGGHVPIGRLPTIAVANCHEVPWTVVRSGFTIEMTIVDVADNSVGRSEDGNSTIHAREIR